MLQDQDTQRDGSRQPANAPQGGDADNSAVSAPPRRAHAAGRPELRVDQDRREQLAGARERAVSLRVALARLDSVHRRGLQEQAEGRPEYAARHDAPMVAARPREVPVGSVPAAVASAAPTGRGSSRKGWRHGG